MEKRIPSPTTPQAGIPQQRTVQAPQRYEGIGNALRAAFDPGSYGVPDDMAGLLRKMDGR